MAVRAADTITLAVLPAVTYTRLYYLKQASTLSAPAKPTTNPPGGAWSATEPAYTPGSTDTLYTSQLTVYGTAGFEYGDVQVSSSFEAAKQAYNLAAAASSAAGTAQSTADGKNKSWFQNDPPAGTGHLVDDMWFDTNNSNRLYRWNGSSWVAATFGSNAFGNFSAAKITSGFLDAARIAAASVDITKLDVTSMWADEAFIVAAQIGVLQAGVIQVDMLAPGIGDSIDLTGNSAVNILISGQAANTQALTEQQANLDGVAGNVAEAQAAADAAQGTADAAQATAEGAAATAAATESTVTELSTYYRFGLDGALIGKSGDPYELSLKNDGIQILYNGVTATEWDAGQMKVPSLVTEEIVIGNHKVEKYGTRTVVRAL